MIFIIVGLLVLFIWLLIHNQKSNFGIKNSEQIQISELIKDTEKRIQESEDLLKELRASRLGDELDLERPTNFEIVGVHIPKRKNYILTYCSRYDFLSLVPEKNNPYSDSAIAVKHNNRIIGHVAERDVNIVHEIIKEDFVTSILEITFDGSYLTVYMNIYY